MDVQLKEDKGWVYIKKQKNDGCAVKKRKKNMCTKKVEKGWVLSKKQKKDRCTVKRRKGMGVQ